MRASVSGLCLLIPLVLVLVGGDFLAILVASCFLGALPLLDLVCLVLAMSKIELLLISKVVGHQALYFICANNPLNLLFN